jgi:phospholipid/cholesterol/gamma-HCH transport system substrate-binding protein
MAERFKLRRVNEITGVFVIAVVAALIVAVVWTGRSQRWFRSSVTLRITLPEAGAAGIRQGSEVYFLGTLVGSVSGVEVDEKGRMEARANIRRDFFLFVRADSSAVVKKKFGVAGDSFFEITRGTGRPLPEKNASIVCNEQFQSALESAIEEIRRETLLVLKKTGAGLDTWTVLGTNLNESRERLNGVIARLDNIAAGVEQGKGTAGKLITDPALADELKQLLAGANEAMSGLQGVVTNLIVAVKNVENGTTRIPEITADVADVTKVLPGLVQQSQTSMRELERLIEALQRQWLIRKYVNHTNPPSSGRLPEVAVPTRPAGKVIASPKSAGK